MPEKNGVFNRFLTQHINERTDGTLYGRHLINSNTRIQGGVFYCPDMEVEACVVDFYQDPFLRNLYDQALEKANGRFGFIPRIVYEVVRSNIGIDREELEHGIPKELVGQEILLGDYIKMRGGKGVCRHHSLATGALLERFIDEGSLGGHVSLRANMRNGYQGHTFVDYTRGGSERPLHIDATNGYFGYGGEHKGWDYSI